MSLITHRCESCGHPDFWRDIHQGVRRDPCPCGCRCTAGGPQVAPSWDVAGRRVQRIAEPGGRFAALMSIHLCGCSACKDLHAQLTTSSPTTVPPEPPSTAGPSTRQLRKWAAEHDIPCPPRGRIPAAVTQAWEAAHGA